MKDVIFVSAVQLATVKLMRRELDDKAILRNDVAATYKQNVVKALVKAGVLRPFHMHYKINDVKVALRVHTPRTPKLEVVAPIANDMRLAA